MKEKIYTIPISEAYDTDCECPLCSLEQNLERESVDYSLGPAMMEPDFRTESNEKGFCGKHFEMMFHSPNKLPLALVLDTHVNEIKEKLKTMAEDIGKNEKRSIFKKDSVSSATVLSDFLKKNESSCMICGKVSKTMERYADVLLDMWLKNEDFRGKFKKSKGVCLKHFRLLCDTAEKNLGKKDRDGFIAALLEKEYAALSGICDDIHDFTLLFDYRSKGIDRDRIKDAPRRTIEKISGYMKQ